MPESSKSITIPSTAARVTPLTVKKMVAQRQALIASRAAILGYTDYHTTKDAARLKERDAVVKTLSEWLRILDRAASALKMRRGNK